MLEENAHSHTFQTPAFLPAQQHQPWDSWFATCHSFTSRWTLEYVQDLVIRISGNWDNEGQKTEEQSFQNQVFPPTFEKFQSPRRPRLQMSYKLTAEQSICLVGASWETQREEGACRGTLSAIICKATSHREHLSDENLADEQTEAAVGKGWVSLPAPSLPCHFLSKLNILAS